MRIDRSSFSELRAMAAVPRPPRPRGVRRAATALLGASPVHLAVLALLVLLVGIGLSIISTTDPQWWRLHFSRLGTFRNSSGAAFNVTLIIGGTLVAMFAHAVGRELRALERHRVRRGTALLARILLTAVGVNLALVGCVPLNVNRFVHDNVAAGMVVSFAVLLLLSPLLMHRMPKRLLATTLAVFGYLFGGGWLFVTATINLALFEVIGFSAMFAWSGVFVVCLTRAGALHAAQAAPAVLAAQPVPALVATDAVTPVRAPFGAAAPAASTSPAAPVGPLGLEPTAAEPVSAIRGDAAPACSGRAPRRRQQAAPARRARRTSARPASRRDARVLPRRGCRGSAAPATSAR